MSHQFNENLLNAIQELISHESNLEDKLNLLTEIGITTSNEKTLQASEEIRSRLCDGDSNNSHSKKRPSNSVALGHSRKKVRNVLPKKSSNEIHGENDTRSALQALLATLKKEKTFTFEGTEFFTLQIKEFLKASKQLDLKIEVLPDSMVFSWVNGKATFNSAPTVLKLQEEIKAKMRL